MNVNGELEQELIKFMSQPRDIEKGRKRRRAKSLKSQETILRVTSNLELSESLPEKMAL